MNRSEIERKMLFCADAALSNLLVWSRDRPEEEELMTPLYTIKHMQNLIRKMFDRYEDRVVPGSAEGEVYFIHIENGYPCHPIYIVGTLVVLLLAGAGRIWIEHAGSYVSSTQWLEVPMITFFVDEMAKSFPNIKTIKSIAEKQNDEVAISFVDKHSEITHVVDIGGQINSYERLEKYRRGVSVHLPAANFIWVDYLSVDKLKKDQKLSNWGERCEYGIMDYECFCMNYGEELYGKGFNFEYTYENTYIWEEMLGEFIEWRALRGVIDVMNVFCFGDGETPKLPERWYGEQVRIINREELVVSQMYYDFTNLLQSG